MPFFKESKTMRRLPLLALLVVLLVPAAVEAQPRFLVGAGLTSPAGDLSDVADAGFHGHVGLFVRVPTTPLGLRGDGYVHHLGAAEATLDDTQILGGTASLVYELPGIQFVPYLLAGIGTYQTETGLLDQTTKSTDTGWHGGFGINLGTGGLGAFAEIRFVQIGVDGGTTRLIPLTVGLRL